MAPERVTCACCRQVIVKSSLKRHMKFVHGPGGSLVKTTEEINIAEGLAKPRWNECRFCHGHFVGLGVHIKKCSENPAVGNNDQQDDEAVENEENHENLGENAGDAIGEHNNANIHDNIDNEAPPAVQEVIIDYGRLVANFNKGLYTPSPTVVEYIKQIWIILWEQAVLNDDILSLKAVAAYQLVPGMVQFLNTNSKKKVIKALEFLRGVISSEDKAQCIIDTAIGLQQFLTKPGSRPFKARNAETMRKEIEQLVKNGRLSAAAKRTNDLEDFLNGAVQSERMTRAEIIEFCNDAFPRGDFRDVLPDKITDPPIANCLQLDGHQIRIYQQITAVDPQVSQLF